MPQRANTGLPFALIETDFPEHMKWNRLDNHEKVLYITLWLTAVRTRAMTINPSIYDLTWLRLHTDANQEQLTARLKHLHTLDLVWFYPPGYIVVPWVYEKHKRVRAWSGITVARTDCYHPWDENPEWRYGNDLPENPSSQLRTRSPLVAYPRLVAALPAIEANFLRHHPTALDTSRKDAQTMAALILEDGFTEDTIIECLLWLFTDESEIARFWAKVIKSLTALRSRRRGQRLTHFERIYTEWTKTFETEE